VDEAAGGVPVDFLLLTRSRVDVGQWFRQGRVWAACAGQRLLIAAVGRRPFLDAVPVREARASLYNPITGELVLAPAPEARLRTLRMTPLEGWKLVERLKQEENEHAGNHH
jgi:hypothetical protein